jgi:hypothetical protein
MKNEFLQTIKIALFFIRDSNTKSYLIICKNKKTHKPIRNGDRNCCNIEKYLFRNKNEQFEIDDDWTLVDRGELD